MALEVLRVSQPLLREQCPATQSVQDLCRIEAREARVTQGAEQRGALIPEGPKADSGMPSRKVRL
eukprot:2181963-Alexandrium_andersonii.AAC.1